MTQIRVFFGFAVYRILLFVVIRVVHIYILTEHAAYYLIYIEIWMAVLQLFCFKAPPPIKYRDAGFFYTFSM